MADERGSAVVEFLLVAVLVVVLVAGIVQLALVLHVRNVLIDSAGEGARYGALSDSSPAAGAARTRELIGMSLSSAYARDVGARVQDLHGQPALEIVVGAPLPVVGLLGPSGTMLVRGRAVLEP